MGLTDTESPLQQYIENTPNGTEIPDETFGRRHIGVLAFTLAFVPFVFGVSRMTGMESITGAELPVIPMLHSIVGTSIVLGLVVIAALPVLPRRIRAATGAVAFMVQASVLAYFTGGFIEAHFLYFVGVGLVALYEDWVPFAPGVKLEDEADDLECLCQSSTASANVLCGLTSRLWNENELCGGRLE